MVAKATEQLHSALTLLVEAYSYIARLQATVAKTEDANRFKINFLAKAAHDLRSPLNGIIGFAELLHSQKLAAITTQQGELLSDILISAKQMLAITNDIMDLAQIELGKMTFHLEEVNLQQILKETVSIFQTLILSKKINMQTELAPSLHKILIDPVRLKQVIYNYVSNALKCTGEGGKVTLRLLLKQYHFIIEVEDTGIGISKEDFPRLFVEFQQLNRDIAKKYPSTGLGLAITKQIVEAQGGKVDVESTVGKGSIFRAILPLAPLQIVS